MFVWCLISLWHKKAGSTCLRKYSQFGCIATWKDKPALGLYQWPCQIQDTGRHLNSGCFVSDWIPPPLSVSRGTTGLAWAIGRAVGWIFMPQSIEARELHEAQLIVKNSYEGYHQKTHWTNKTSKNCISRC